MMHTFLSNRAREMPNKTFVVQGQRRFTYGEINQKTVRLAAFLLGNGLQKGDRVGILSENSPEYIASYFAVQKAGGIPVDINFHYSAYEIKKIINHCSASILIVEDKYRKVVVDFIKETPSIYAIISIDTRSSVPSSLSIEENIPSHVRCICLDDAVKKEEKRSAFPSSAGEDIASIVYTSGTTGEPKGVMLSHDNFMANACSIIDYLHLTESDRVMVVLPFCYSYGKSLLTTHLLVGGTLILENSFMYPNVVLEKMVEEGVTGFAGVPSTFAILLNRSNIRKYLFPKLRYVTQAGGAMPPRHAFEFSKILPLTEIYIMYGQTEATARLTYLEPRDLHKKPGSIGKPIPRVNIELVKDSGTVAEEGQEGEIVVRGKNVMLGYWNNMEETAKVLQDGTLYTGDIAKKDQDGYLYIVGRRSDMMKSGANRISPKEIEEVILELSEVHEAAVVGVYDEILGEAIRAVIVLREGREMDAKKVQRHCQAKLASFKIPKEVVFVGELPKTSSGKVRRCLLKEQNQFGAYVTQEKEQYPIMKICTQCVLPETFPGISFNAEGVCNHCQKSDGRRIRREEEKKKYELKFIELMKKEVNGSGNHIGRNDDRPYDVLMAYSGGKDSTYTMGLLKNKYRLRILAVSLDNGFISQAALANIKNVTESLAIDHLFFKPRWDVLKKIFSAAAERELYAKKTLERASTVCTSCIGIVKSICLKIALEQNIPMIAFGWSPGQAPLESSIMKNNPALIRMTQQAILTPLRQIAGGDIDAYFLKEKHYAEADRFPYNVHPMAWEFYNEQMILKEIRQFGWTAPTDTDSNSTNCLLNAFANDIHLKRYRFHPYVWEIANMTREGVMTREEGYQKIYGEQNKNLIDTAKEKLAGDANWVQANLCGAAELLPLAEHAERFKTEGTIPVVSSAKVM